MAQRYHKGRNNTPMPCKAEPGNCPMGSSSEHGSFEQVQAFCDKYNSIIYEMPDEELREKAMADNEDGDIYRTALCEKMNGDKEPKTVKIKDLKFSDYKEGNSGLSLNVNTNKTLQGGFCLSPYPEHSVAIKGDLTDEEFRNKVNDYVKENKKILQKANHCLGLWRSPYDGALYMDISIMTDDASIAREKGKENDQQAYFDLQQGEGFTIDADAKSGQLDLEDVENVEDMYKFLNDEERKQTKERTFDLFKEHMTEHEDEYEEYFYEESSPVPLQGGYDYRGTVLDESSARELFEEEYEKIENGSHSDNEVINDIFFEEANEIGLERE